MSFEINYKQRVSKILDISIDEVSELLKRAEGHIRKNGVNRHELAKMFFILENINNRKEEQRVKDRAPLLEFKHKGIVKYRGDIVRLYQNEVSAERIAKKYNGKKDAPSLSTIKRYLKALNTWREDNGIA